MLSIQVEKCISKGPNKSHLLPDLSFRFIYALLSVQVPSRQLRSTKAWMLPGHLFCTALATCGLVLVECVSPGSLIRHNNETYIFPAKVGICDHGRSLMGEGNQVVRSEV